MQALVTPRKKLIWTEFELTIYFLANFPQLHPFIAKCQQHVKKTKTRSWMIMQQLTFLSQILVDYDSGDLCENLWDFLKNRTWHLMKSVSSDEKLVFRIMKCSLEVQSRNKWQKKLQTRTTLRRKWSELASKTKKR